MTTTQKLISTLGVLLDCSACLSSLSCRFSSLQARNHSRVTVLGIWSACRHRCEVCNEPRRYIIFTSPLRYYSLLGRSLNVGIGIRYPVATFAPVPAYLLCSRITTPWFILFLDEPDQVKDTEQHGFHTRSKTPCVFPTSLTTSSRLRGFSFAPSTSLMSSSGPS